MNDLCPGLMVGWQVMVPCTGMVAEAHSNPGPSWCWHPTTFLCFSGPQFASL